MHFAKRFFLKTPTRTRDRYFAKLDTSSLDAYAKTIEPYRKAFDKDVIGRFDDPLLPLNPRSRKVFDEPKYTGYEVMIYSCSRGDATLFSRGDLVEAAWRIAQPLMDYWTATPARRWPILVVY